MEGRWQAGRQAGDGRTLACRPRLHACVCVCVFQRLGRAHAYGGWALQCELMSYSTRDNEQGRP